MKNNWKFMGLLFSLALELSFWFLYLSSLLVKIGSPLGDIVWLLSGVSGIVFGVINLMSCPKMHSKVLSVFALVTGVVLVPLWMLAVFITSM